MIILIWKRNTNKKSQHPVSTDENVCYTTSNSLIEDSKEYVYKWYNNTVLCHIWYACRIYAEIDHENQADSNVIQQNTPYNSQVQNAAYTEYV